MSIRRIWGLGIGSVVVAFIIAACGGGSTATSVPAAEATPVPAATAGPAATGEASTPVPADGSPGSSGSTGTVTGYTWRLDTVDNDGAKPSLATPWTQR